MIGQMTIVIAFPGFIDIGRSMIPIFLLMDYFLHRFSALSEEVSIFLRSALSASVLFSCSSICAIVSNASCRGKFGENW